MATPAPGTIPALPPYQPAALPITGQEAVEIVSSLNAATAASFSMLITDLVGKAPSAMPSKTPASADVIAVFSAASNTPYQTTLGNLAIVAGNLPTDGATSYILSKNSPTNYDTSWNPINTFVIASTGLASSGTAVVNLSFATQTGLSVLGVAGNATAVPAAITGGTSNQVLAVNAGGTGLLFTTLPAGLATIAGLSVLGVTGTSNAVPAAITGTTGQFLQVNAGGTGLLFAAGPSGLSTTTGISVLGVTGTANAVPAAIIGTGAQVLRVSDNGSTLAFGALNLGSSAAVTGVLPVSNGGSGASTLTSNAVLLGNGTTAVQFATIGTGGRALLDQGAGTSPLFTQIIGDISLTAGGTATIGTGVVTNLKLATMPASTILANPTNASAAVVNATAGQINAMLPVFVQSGASAAQGLVPSPGTTAGITRLLCEDATWHNARQILTTTTNYYINASSGSDTNAGTLASPWQTIQHAFNYITTQLDFNGKTVVVQCQDGTYSGFTAVPTWLGGGSLILQGNATAIVNTVINSGTTHAIAFASGPVSGILTVQNFLLETNSTGAGYGVLHNTNGNINLGAMNYGVCGGGHIAAFSPGAVVTFTGNYTISGGAPTHYQCVAGSSMFVTGLTVTINSTPAFTDFANVNGPCFLQIVSDTFTGSATGAHYTGSANGIIYTGGASTTYLPGNSAGTTNTGAQYL